MPTKIMVWNIQNFTINRINFDAGERVSLPVPGGSFSFFETSTTILKNDYIMENVQKIDPDIFIVIEVVSGQGFKGSLVSGKGKQGVLMLAQRLQQLSNNWKLVPPLKLTDRIQIGEVDGDEDEKDKDFKELLKEGGYTEAIAVYFRSDKVDFIGPYVWPDAPGNDKQYKTSVPPGINVKKAPYPDDWQHFLPNGNYFAGQFEFLTPDKKHPFLFPAQASRRPFLTSFMEKTGMLRKLTIAAVHFPPNYFSAAGGLGAMATYFQKVYKPDPNEILMIAGDYNINPHADPGQVFTQSLKNDRYIVMLGTETYSTMNKKNSYAEPVPANGQPGYLRKDLVLDNIAFQYTSPAAKDGDPSITVVDRVAPNRYSLYTPMAAILNQPTPEKQNKLFRKPFNFWKIGPTPGTSDHLAIAIQI